MEGVLHFGKNAFRHSGHSGLQAFDEVQQLALEFDDEALSAFQTNAGDLGQESRFLCFDRFDEIWNRQGRDDRKSGPGPYPRDAVQLFVELAFPDRGKAEKAHVVLGKMEMGVQFAGLAFIGQRFERADRDVERERHAHGGFNYGVHRAFMDQGTFDITDHF